MKFVRRISEAIARHGLPGPGCRLLVALSGGADSVALLLVLRELGYATEAAHCNFSLRGSESDRDEAFCRRLCDRLGVRLHVRRFDTAGEAARTHESIEMAARRLRYDWFGTLLDGSACEAVAVAHHRDDNVETLLLNLLRGSGLRGLTGMRYAGGRVVRPLLDVTRRDILDFLSARGQDYVTDSTNAETLYKRNKVRHRLLPLLREINPAADATLAATAGRLAETAEIQDRALECVRRDLALTAGGGDLPLPGTDVPTRLGDIRVSRTLLFELLRPYGFSPAVVADICDGAGCRGGALYEAADYLAVVHRRRLEVRRRPETMAERTVAVPGRTELCGGLSLKTRLLDRDKLAKIPRRADVACLDADRVDGQPTCRRAKQGDRFAPYGMKGTKLVSDYLTDRRCSRLDRLAACVVADRSGILWLVGERPDQRAAVTQTTRRVLLIELEKNDKSLLP